MKKKKNRKATESGDYKQRDYDLLRKYNTKRLI